MLHAAIVCNAPELFPPDDPLPPWSKNFKAGDGTPAEGQPFTAWDLQTIRGGLLPHYSKYIFHYSLNKITVREPSRGRIMEVFFTITAITGITEKRRITPRLYMMPPPGATGCRVKAGGNPGGKQSRDAKKKRKTPKQKRNTSNKEEYNTMSRLCRVLKVLRDQKAVGSSPTTSTTGNPGSVRLPGHFSFLGIAWKRGKMGQMGENWGKITSTAYRRAADRRRPAAGQEPARRPGPGV